MCKLGNCYIDNPNKLHWENICWSCNSTKLRPFPSCSCGTQCGHPLIYACFDCNKKQLPKKDDYCSNIKLIMDTMKKLK